MNFQIRNPNTYQDFDLLIGFIDINLHQDLLLPYLRDS